MMRISFFSTLLAILATSAPLRAQDRSTTLPWAPPAGQPMIELVRVDHPVPTPPHSRTLFPSPNLNLGMTTVAGDIDGDGFAEIAAAMPIKHFVDSQGNQVVQAGAVKVYRGSDLSEWREITPPEPTFQGRFGASMIIADVDGDSFGDLVITAWARQSQYPASWIYHGPSLTRVRCLAQPLMGASGATRNSFGVGDTNGDGVLDLVHANPFVWDPVFGGGAVFVYEGPDLTNVRTIPRPDTVTQLFGISCAVGDVNGDGFDDVVATDPHSDLPDGTPAQGRIWVFFGPDFSTNVVRRNPDGVPQIRFGETCVISDLNADGFGDVALGAPRAVDASGAQGGAVFVYWGPGLKKSQVTRLVNTPPSLFGGSFGQGLAAGDMDLDGVTDLLVGAPNTGHPDPFGTPRSGHVNVLFGPDFLRSERAFGPPPCFCGSSDSIGTHIDVADISGDGYPDLALGAPLADFLKGRVYYADLSSLRPFASYRSRRAGDPVPSMRISASGQPAPGRTFRVRVSGLPRGSPAWIWMAETRGASRLVPPADARVIGTPDPGRYLLLSLPTVPRQLTELDDSQAMNSNTERRYCDFQVPMDASLLGQRVRMQAFALDPSDPLGMVESDGLVVTIAGW